MKNMIGDNVALFALVVGNYILNIIYRSFWFLSYAFKGDRCSVITWWTSSGHDSQYCSCFLYSIVRWSYIPANSAQCKRHPRGCLHLKWNLHECKDYTEMEKAQWYNKWNYRYLSMQIQWQKHFIRGQEKQITLATKAHKGTLWGRQQNHKPKFIQIHTANQRLD